MSRQVAADWKGILIAYYILQLFSYISCNNVHVQLLAPRYVKYNSTAVLICNHSVSEERLDKIEFSKNTKKILQYIRGRIPAFRTWQVDGATMDYSENGTTIKLMDVRFDASGPYSCAVSTDTPIYTKSSEEVKLHVIVPQTENPVITFEKSSYYVGEYLEANCSSSAANPVPHLTWYINGKEVDVSLVNDFPITHLKGGLMSATAKLKIKVLESHAGENSSLEISCFATIPAYPNRHQEYADMKNRTVMVEIIPMRVTMSSSSKVVQEMASITILGMLITISVLRKIVP
ncbi:uncharacterized protein [Prorops nasuta]|uniref:uncharacterized protein n=1 Tax=Prorops nasuta TaxID=863751 RepID=UPI0034CF2DDF